jgi:hypothetical protein
MRLNLQLSTAEALALAHDARCWLNLLLLLLRYCWQQQQHCCQPDPLLLPSLV